MSANVITSYDEDTNLGYFQLNWPGTDTAIPLNLPSGVGSFNRRACMIEMRKRKVFAGQFTKILTYTEHNQLVTAGVTAPLTAPVLATAAGASLVGNVIVYALFRHKRGTTIVQDSNLSTGSSTVAFSGAHKPAITSIPTAADARVTHVVIFVSVDGALPQEWVELALGTTSYSANVGTADLGDPPPINAAGELTNSRGVPPYCRFVRVFNNRAWYFGDSRYPYRLWYSDPDEMESVGALSFIDTKHRETITAGGMLGNTLGIFGQQAIYLLQGFDIEDFVLDRVDGTVGCINFFGMVDVNGIMYWPAEMGFYGWFGAPRLQMRDKNAYLWQTQYKANPSRFERGQAIDDRASAIIKFLTIRETTPRSRYWIGSYKNVDATQGGGGEMEWTFDYRGREDSAMGVLLDPNTARGELYTGSCDGYVRKENVADDADDDGDEYGKLVTLETGALAPGHQKGTYVEAYEYTWVDLFVMSESQGFTLEGRAGDDTAYLLNTPPFTLDVPASAGTSGGRSQVARTSHRIHLHGLSGKTVSFKLLVLSPVGLEYRGLGITWEPGVQTRGRA